MEDNLLQPQQLSDVMADIESRVEKDKAVENEVTQVVVTPAWQVVIDNLNAKCSPQAIIADVRAAVYDKTMSDAQLGQLVRVSILSADDLKATIDQVTETVKAHEK